MAYLGVNERASWKLGSKLGRELSVLQLAVIVAKLVKKVEGDEERGGDQYHFASITYACLAWFRQPPSKNSKQVSAGSANLPFLYIFHFARRKALSVGSLQLLGQLGMGAPPLQAYNNQTTATRKVIRFSALDQERTIDTNLPAGSLRKVDNLLPSLQFSLEGWRPPIVDGQVYDFSSDEDDEFSTSRISQLQLENILRPGRSQEQIEVRNAGINLQLPPNPSRSLCHYLSGPPTNTCPCLSPCHQLRKHVHAARATQLAQSGTLDAEVLARTLQTLGWDATVKSSQSSSRTGLKWSGLSHKYICVRLRGERGIGMRCVVGELTA